MNGSTPESTPQGQEAPQPAANPPADAESIRQQVLNEVFNGKYKSVEDAKQGFWNLNNYASQAHAALAERANPAPARPDPFAALEQEALVKPDYLREAIRQEASQLVNQALSPMLEAAKARDTIVRNMPEFVKNEPAIMGWLSKNPEVAADVGRLNDAKLYDLAAKTALYAWQTANPPGHQGNPEAKAQAQLIQGQQTQGRGLEGQPNMEEIRAQAIRYGHMTGDKRAAYSMVFPNFKIELPPHLKAHLQT